MRGDVQGVLQNRFGPGRHDRERNRLTSRGLVGGLSSSRGGLMHLEESAKKVG
jgi:hypothetical protein